ncbi:MAG: hypothetical protein WBI94_03805 [Candidatus Cloacimonadaceae bacterium]|jgi:hypothetical protein
MNLKPTKTREVVEPRSFPRVNYPVLRSISRIYEAFAWLSLIVGVIAFVLVLALMRNTEAIGYGALAIFGGAVLFIGFKVMAEIVILSTDISISAREILIHLTEKDALADSSSGSESSEVNSQ